MTLWRTLADQLLHQSVDGNESSWRGMGGTGARMFAYPPIPRLEHPAVGCLGLYETLIASPDFVFLHLFCLFARGLGVGGGGQVCKWISSDLARPLMFIGVRYSGMTVQEEGSEVQKPQARHLWTVPITQVSAGNLCEERRVRLPHCCQCVVAFLSNILSGIEIEPYWKGGGGSTA